VRSTNHELALAARDLLVTTLSIDAPAPDDMLGSIAAVPVPPDPEPSESIFDPLTTALQEKWSIEVPVFAWPESPQRLLRISAQQYNRLDDYLRLAEALSEELALG
jgi:isopenicillin-N epimerase